AIRYCRCAVCDRYAHVPRTLLRLDSRHGLGGDHGRRKCPRLSGRPIVSAESLSQAYLCGPALPRAVRIPAIVLNFKTYSGAMGKKGWDFARRLASVAGDPGASIVLCPPMSDLAHVAKLVHIPVFAQHVDAVEAGPTTGWSPPEALLEAGAAGTLINHSERKVAWEEMAKSIPRCQQLGLEVVACADDISEAETLAKLSPEYIAIEPPELIGRHVSVTTAKPEVISRAVARVHTVNPQVEGVCRAGVRLRKGGAYA